jgi:hypothetical protein
MHPHIPDEPGIYLFSENNQPVYVGQTRRLRTRLRQHTAPNGTHYSATFAFLLANENSSGEIRKVSRRDRVLDAAFRDNFTAQRARVGAMDVQFIVVKDPIERTMLEMYAALHLETEEYNSFETH